MLKEVSPPYLVFSSISVTAATYTSSATGIQYKDSVGYQFAWTGLITATVNINGSIDFNPGQPQSSGAVNPGAWTTITSATIGSGTLQPLLFNLNQLAMPWTQIQCVTSSGTGIISAYVTAKSLG